MKSQDLFLSSSCVMMITVMAVTQLCKFSVFFLKYQIGQFHGAAEIPLRRRIAQEQVY